VLLGWQCAIECFDGALSHPDVAVCINCLKSTELLLEIMLLGGGDRSDRFRLHSLYCSSQTCLKLGKLNQDHRYENNA
jgi:hypothetical protein